MLIQKKQKRAQLASLVATIAAAMFANSVDAGGFEPIQRLGRHCGFGWGDGYHACKDSGFRPGADLPPRSYTKQFLGARTSGASCDPGSLCAATSFYDQFDAAAHVARSRSDQYGCDAYGYTAADYSTARTYVVAGPSFAGGRCSSGSCDDPSCDNMGCDGAAVNRMPTTNAGSQSWVPTNIDPAATSLAPANPAPANPVPANPVPANPVPANPIPANPVPANPVPTNPVPAANTGVVPAQPSYTLPPPTQPTAASSEDADGKVTSPSDRKLVLPPPGFSEDESPVVEAKEKLPTPESFPLPKKIPSPGDVPSIESIPAPQPDAAPNPPMPAELGPLDASLAPKAGFPEGWSEKPVTTNRFFEQDTINQVKRPVTLDLIPESVGPEEDDLLLFESAQSNRPTARVARAIQPSQIAMPDLPEWARPSPVYSAPTYSGHSSTLPSSSMPKQVRPPRIPSSLFITQPD